MILGIEHDQDKILFRLPENVISLTDYKKRRLIKTVVKLTYVHTDGLWLDWLIGTGLFQMTCVNSNALLRSPAVWSETEMVLVESSLGWSSAIAAVKYIAAQTTSPIVMICSAADQRKKSFLKKAFSVGVCDTLFTPLKKDELLETVEVLLKFQMQLSSLN